MAEIKIIYEDNHLLVVEKPVNLLTQGDITGDQDLLSLLKQGLKEKYQKPGNVYLGMVHRLDRPTGGAIVFAKTSKAAARLSAQLKANTFARDYLAVVHGKLSAESASLQHYLHKNKQTNTVSVVNRNSAGAKAARLTYQVVDTRRNFSLVEVQLQTGRPHQIRVQFAAAGHPLFGDQRYGQTLNRPGQQLALWSYCLSFRHPTLKTPLIFTSHPAPKHPWTLFAYKSSKETMI